MSNQEANGDSPRVAFGDGPNQSIPHDWAEGMLTRWAADNPTQFGAYLAEQAVGVRLSTRKPRGAGRG